MGSSLTIINQEQQKKLYKNLEGKWVIELDSEKIKNIFVEKRKHEKKYSNIDVDI